MLLGAAPGIAQQASGGIEGSVHDAAGLAVAGAKVRLEASGTKPIDTQTDARGAFAFLHLQAGKYSVSAEKDSLHSQVVAATAGDAGKPVDLVLGSASSQPMEFADSPDFTVAGVTDWTAVGGHGSDAILRTSEDLARETLRLKGQGSTDSSAGSVAVESRLRAALVSSPGSFAANYKLGVFYLNAGRALDALPLLLAAYQLDAGSYANEQALTRAYLETGDISHAREHLDKMLAHENSAELHRLAAEVDEKTGDPLAAVRQDEQAVRLDPSEQNYFAWGSELLLHRAVWQAAEVFRNGVKAYPQSARMLTGLGTALFAGDRYDEAAQRLCEASDLDPKDTEPYLFMGKVELAAPTPLACIEPKLARFAQMQPENSVANYLYGMALLKQQAHSADKSANEQAQTLLTKAVSLDSKCFDGYLQLGILAFSQHNYEEAIRYYKQAIEADPQLGEAHYRLGVVYDRTGKPEEAKREFQLHEDLDKQQAAEVDRQRREVKQFLVDLHGVPEHSAVQ